MNQLRNTVGPLALIVLCPISAWLLWYSATTLDGSLLALFQLMAVRGVVAALRTIIRPHVLGSFTTLAMVLSYAAFQLLLMRLVPLRRFTGLCCFLLTLTAFLSCTFVLGLFSPAIIFDHLPDLIGTLNCLSLLLCVFLYFKGRFSPSTPDHGVSGNLIFDFYWGTELYPRVFGFDVKTFTNCRFGMTAWALVVISYAAKQSELSGLSNSMGIALGLQLIYLAKFFLWETGYLRSTDIAYDRAGFYICWGCLVWVPCVYTLPTLYLVQRPHTLASPVAVALGVLGTLAVVITYLADAQKERVRREGRECIIWGKPARVLQAHYLTDEGERKTSLLLASGYWGLSRHFHYLPEWIAALCWTLPAGFDHLLPYFYVIFLGILLLHRIGRLEKRCEEKYGLAWNEYKRTVANRLIPDLRKMG